MDSALYQVVAIRNDGARVVLAVNLRIDRAQAIVKALSGIAAFQSVAVEAQATKGRPQGDSGSLSDPSFLRRSFFV